MSNTAATERPVIKKYLIEKKPEKRIGQILNLKTVGFFRTPLYTKLSKSKTFEIKENAEPSPKFSVPSLLPTFHNNKKLVVKYNDGKTLLSARRIKDLI